MKPMVKTVKPAAKSIILPVGTGLLQRKCACGARPGPTGEMSSANGDGWDCSGSSRSTNQETRYEQEADRVAETIMRGGITAAATRLAR